MSECESADYVLKRLAHYKREKRLQGFLLHKARSNFKKMKTNVRKLQMGVPPPSECRIYLKVSDQHKI